MLFRMRMRNWSSEITMYVRGTTKSSWVTLFVEGHGKEFWGLVDRGKKGSEKLVQSSDDLLSLESVYDRRDSR